MKFRRIGREMWDMSKIPPGIGLYTLRNETKADFIGTLKKVADMGYKVVEFVGYEQVPAIQMKKALDELGLDAVSTMVSLEDAQKDLNKEIIYAKTIGVRYFVIPYVPKEIFQDVSKYKSLVSTLKKIGMEVKRYGLQFLYHPHAHEFEKINGKYIIDRLLDDVGRDVMQLELDLYWAKKAGIEPLAALQAYKGSVPLVHLKDIGTEGEFKEVGQGIIDWPPIFSFFRDAGVNYYFVEQDVSHNPLESVKISLDYIKSIGPTSL